MRLTRRKTTLCHTQLASRLCEFAGGGARTRTDIFGTTKVPERFAG
eukprot:gene14594-21758_t